MTTRAVPGQSRTAQDDPNYAKRPKTIHNKQKLCERKQECPGPSKRVSGSSRRTKTIPNYPIPSKSIQYYPRLLKAISKAIQDYETRPGTNPKATITSPRDHLWKSLQPFPRILQDWSWNPSRAYYRIASGPLGVPRRDAERQRERGGEREREREMYISEQASSRPAASGGKSEEQGRGRGVEEGEARGAIHEAQGHSGGRAGVLFACASARIVGSAPRGCRARAARVPREGPEVRGRYCGLHLAVAAN